MKLLLTVQGEGRGHMTQALAVQQWSRRQGHEVVAVLGGTNRNRSWPDYFEHGFDVPVQRLASPGFATARGRSVNLPATLWQLVTRMREFRESLNQLDQTIRETQPDLLINFLEPLVGWRNRFGTQRVPVLAVGHQFMIDHPILPKLRRHGLQQWGLKNYVAATGYGSTRYALSFYPAADNPSQGRLVGPPLLREELFKIDPKNGDFLLVYLLNDGYRADIERWHRQHPSVPIHCFYDRCQAAEIEAFDDTLTFHRLHGGRFLESMARCRGVVCTAGFESISEAACLGKPVLAIPVEGHIEQTLNVLDAEKGGLAIPSRSFDLERLLDSPSNRTACARFREWLGESDERLARAVTWAVRRPMSRLHRGGGLTTTAATIVGER